MMTEQLSLARFGDGGHATMSSDGRYRYRLERNLAASPEESWEGPHVGFVMLNPSTADHRVNDPTIRRCMSFGRAWGCGRLVVANLFGLRATNPKEMEAADDPVGPENDDLGIGELWAACAGEPDRIVVAWGSHGDRWPERVRQVVDGLTKYVDGDTTILWCLGTTKSGQPRHPLYVRGDTELIRWEQQ